MTPAKPTAVPKRRAGGAGGLVRLPGPAGRRLLSRPAPGSPISRNCWAKPAGPATGRCEWRRPRSSSSRTPFVAAAIVIATSGVRGSGGFPIVVVGGGADAAAAVAAAAAMAFLVTGTPPPPSPRRRLGLLFRRCRGSVRLFRR